MNDAKRQRRRQPWREWRARNKEKLRQKRQKKKLESLPKIRQSGFQIIALSDPRLTTKTIRYICLKHTNRNDIGWEAVWNLCDKIDSPLSDWFKVLRSARVEPVADTAYKNREPMPTAIRIIMA